jgi:CubicO group peptidase (beta-lactamase class C family)
MKKIIGLGMLLASLLSSQILLAQDKQANLDALVKKLGEKFIDDKQAVGLSIGVYTEGAGHFYNFGTTIKDKAIAPTQNTVYEVGSITKTFVSFILAKAVLESNVRLDDDIRQYLNESYPNLEYKGNPIKLVHLANTTSRLPDWLPELPVAMKNLPADSAMLLKINYYRNFTSNDFFKALHNVKLDTIPGTKRYHSNAGAQLLAYILEGIYKTTMEELIKKYITEPYNMNSTSFVDAKRMNTTAIGYTGTDKEAVYEFVMPYFKNAGGLGSTAHDLVNYIKTFLNESNAAALLCLKKTVDIDASSGKVAKMRPDNIAAPEVYSVALNWFKYQPSHSSSQVWADGGTNGFNSYLVIYPHLNSGVIILANKSDEKIFRSLPGIAYEISKAIDAK